MDVPGDKLPSVASGALAAYLRETTAPQVPEQLRAAFLAAIDAGRLRSMLNKQMTLTPLHRPGALLLGDAFNMRYAAHLSLPFPRALLVVKFHWRDCTARFWMG